MQSLEKGDLERAARDSDQLDALLWRTSQREPSDQDKGMQKNVQRILAVASLDLRGNLASFGGHYDRAVALLNDAVKKEQDIGYSEPPQYSRPALESLGYAYIRARKWEDSRAAFEKALAERPKSGFALYGIAYSYEQQGELEKAATAYCAFLEAWKNADTDLPQIQSARAFVAIRK
jgi:tetratricopeptide (TPR) repeat protein